MSNLEKIVKWLGRISMTEDKDTKIICEKVETLDRSSNEMEQVSTGKGRRTKHPGLYLKVSNQTDRRYAKAMQYIEIFDGATPLYILFTDTQKLMMAPARFRVSVNDVLLKALKDLLGEENVAFVRP